MNIIYEDNHILVLNKRTGEIVQGDKTGDEPLSEQLKRYIKERDNKPGNVFMGVPHRLDRPVSGIAMFAKTSKALARLNEMFAQHAIDKRYWAITAQRPPQDSGQLKHFLSRNEKQNKSYVCPSTQSGAKEAILNYKLLCQSDRYYLIEVELLTGRHHQIRAQLAAIGCPIKGDLKYGAPRSNPDGSISLHARSLSLIHPVKKENISLTAPVPDEALWQWFEQAISLI